MIASVVVSAWYEKGLVITITSPHFAAVLRSRGSSTMTRMEWRSAECLA